MHPSFLNIETSDGGKRDTFPFMMRSHQYFMMRTHEMERGECKLFHL